MKPLLLFFALSLAAQAQTPSNYVRLFRYQPNPDGVAELMDLQRDTAEVYKANKAPFARRCWTSLAGSQTVFVSVRFNTLTEMGEPTWLSKQGSDLEKNGRSQRLARSLNNMESVILTPVAELTWDDTPTGAPEAYGVVTTIRVKPSRVAAFVAASKDVNDYMKKAGKAKSIYTSRMAFGGNVYDYIVLATYEKLEDVVPVNPGDFRKAIGEEKYAAYLKSNADNIESVERTIVRYRPEFSYQP